MTLPELPPIAVPPVAAPLLAYQRQLVPGAPPAWTSVRMYGLLPEAMVPFIRRQLVMTLVMRLVLSVPIVAVAIWFMRDNLEIGIMFACIFAVLQIGGMALAMWRNATRTRREWSLLRIFVADQGIMRSLPGFPDVIITNEQVKRIFEAGNGMAVVSIKKPVYISIPRGIESYDQIRSHLAAVKPLYSPLKTWIHAIRGLAVGILVMLVSLGGFAGGLYWRDLRLELLALACCGGIILWSFVRTLRNPNVTVGTKISSGLSLFMPLVLAAKILLLHLLRL